MLALTIVVNTSKINIISIDLQVIVKYSKNEFSNERYVNTSVSLKNKIAENILLNASSLLCYYQK